MMILIKAKGGSRDLRGSLMMIFKMLLAYVINHNDADDDDYDNTYSDDDGDDDDDDDDYDQDREFQGRRSTFAKLDLVRKIGQELLLEFDNIENYSDIGPKNPKFAFLGFLGPEIWHLSWNIEFQGLKTKHQHF